MNVTSSSSGDVLHHPHGLNVSVGGTDEEEGEVDSTVSPDEDGRSRRRPTRGQSRIEFERLAAFFHVPINEAAKGLGVCATVLKKVCRKHGIPRWPHRKIKKLDTMLAMLETAANKPGNPQHDDDVRKKMEAVIRDRMVLMTEGKLIGEGKTESRRARAEGKGRDRKRKKPDDEEEEQDPEHDAPENANYTSPDNVNEQTHDHLQAPQVLLGSSGTPHLSTMDINGLHGISGGYHVMSSSGGYSGGFGGMSSGYPIGMGGMGSMGGMGGMGGMSSMNSMVNGMNGLGGGSLHGGGGMAGMGGMNGGVSGMNALNGMILGSNYPTAAFNSMFWNGVGAPNISLPSVHSISSGVISSTTGMTMHNLPPLPSNTTPLSPTSLGPSSQLLIPSHSLSAHSHHSHHSHSHGHYSKHPRLSHSDSHDHANLHHPNSHLYSEFSLPPDSNASTGDSSHFRLLGVDIPIHQSASE